ncbi:uncharacterized protein LOC110254013 [Exaiptasia diaphana]|uniref:Short-chain dehydrogenase n=1 Tax=Exaiptasia diaphana TaxID=2652724 RepID=A0A913YA97_EXADI|nr:uncharacterized protein LOC110254013 [Exaiptasia diaphana]KXJ19616.1 Serine 3-dehydrogenase [Exaiptasia diaphana]
MKTWAVITGAGTGIGAALAKELSGHGFNVLAIGRRLTPLQETQKSSPDTIHPLAVDIATSDGQRKILDFIPEGDNIKYLVQNAAVGAPSRLQDIQREEFEYAFSVNVTAPLMLVKGFFPRLNNSKGRIIHLGTGVAKNPQLGTITYGITKMAFQRLFEQLVVELKGSNVQIAEIHPGVVDTEGLWEHIKLAKEQKLPHVSYFDEVQKEGRMSTAEISAKFLKFVLVDSSDEEFSTVWNIHDNKHWQHWKTN